MYEPLSRHGYINWETMMLSRLFKWFMSCKEMDMTFDWSESVLVDTVGLGLLFCLAMERSWMWCKCWNEACSTAFIFA
ncbi:hypothetical protein WICPIJ_004609 [Wickerhamomyces pijperi]|uniref:Uncharacterized protein n=1 Tax=Wickerhamomyces pijperi TaxID=599730 RepID=A0A9P8TLW3_WICPI|nr:hypothetical protein WICPIJ_004609 [Wickerhamomyces pijperi]